MAVLEVGQTTGLSVDDGVSRHVQQYMAVRGVSVDTLAVALGLSFADTLCKLAGCGEWLVDDVWRAALVLGVDGALLVS
ncbi:hypothetical protein [Oerskovia enterophila]|uniref:hypothetical protein n=1 Tax=Oerskovia enterophila TaxID=43678 RepID=UPI0038121ECC